MNFGGTYLGGTFRVGSADGTLASNYANSAMTLNGSTVSDNTPNGGNGGAVTLAVAETENWWKTTVNWSSKFGSSEAAPWKWDSNRKRPVLWFE
jgi:hypothetical protein